MHAGLAWRHLDQLLPIVLRAGVDSRLSKYIQQHIAGLQRAALDPTPPKADPGCMGTLVNHCFTENIHTCRYSKKRKTINCCYC